MEETYVAQTESTLPQPVVEQPKKNFQKWILAVLIIAILLTAGTGTYFLSQKSAIKTAETTSFNKSAVKEKTTIPTLTISPTNGSGNKNDKSTWNTYTSSNNSYSFKYPSDGNWKMPLSQTSVGCPRNDCPKSYNIYSFTVEKSDKTSIQQFISSLNTTNPKINTPDNPYIVDYKLISINGLGAVEALNPATPQSGTGPTVSVFIVIDGVGYLYSYTYIDPNLNSATKLDQLPDPNPNILSTLKFGDQTTTSSNTTSGWKTYTNLKHGVTLKYPLNWFANGGNDINACIMFSDSSDPSPVHSHTVISLCTDPQPLPTDTPDNNSTDDNIKTQITLNGYQGIRVKQTSNWGQGEGAFFSNPKGGSTGIVILFGDTNIFNLILSTFKFTD